MASRAKVATDREPSRARPRPLYVRFGSLADAKRSAENVRFTSQGRHCPPRSSRDYKARLWAVIALNASMFALEMGAGVIAGSEALQADALDFLGDTFTYGMSLAVIGLSLRVRATAALIKGATLAVCTENLNPDVVVMKSAKDRV